MATRAMPKVADPGSWQSAIEALRRREKALTRARDEVNALRRRLPMVRIDKRYEFDGEAGRATLADLFAGRPQLIVYHFMFGPDWEAGCEGCSWVTDAMPHLAHLHARDTSLVLISRAPIQRLLDYRRRMGWTLPWYSSLGSDFNVDMGATTGEGENHMTSVFFTDGRDVFRTYYTDRRGVEHLGSHWTYLDLTPYGRQEPWEDSPPDWPKGELHWTRRHDEYGA